MKTHCNRDRRKMDVHAVRPKNIEAMIAGKHPALKVEMPLMALDGKVETIE